MVDSKSSGRSKDVIHLLLKQSEAYDTIERIETLLENLDSLAPLPVQPLFMAIKSCDSQAVAKLLPRLSKSQRQAFLDIDLWHKDGIDPDAFPYWLQAYCFCADDEIKSEFAKGLDFLLYLKSAFNVWTFDVDDPQYPDHDNYFLTEDSLLLFEFSDDYPYVEEVRQLVRHLYSELGVERAYQHLLSMVTESFTLIEEGGYQAKIARLQDFGLIDFYDALELIHPLASIAHIDSYLKKKELNFTPKLEGVALNETLHHSTLVAYRERMERFSEELQKVQNEQRKNFLQFNFIKLVNASLAAENAIKDGRLALTRIGKKARTSMLLGFDYTKEFVAKPENHALIPVSGSVFDRYDFVDFYKVGQTLIQSRLKSLKKNLVSYHFDGGNEGFLGKFWSEFLDESFAEIVRVGVTNSDAQEVMHVVDRIDLYQVWCDRCELLLELLPFMMRFKDTFDQLVETGNLQEHFYLNYSIADIDFEAIILSSFANHLLGSYDRDKNPEGSPKMGLTIDEFKRFTGMILTKSGEVIDEVALGTHIESFRRQYGFSTVQGFPVYIREILGQQLLGYDYQNLNLEDYRHVGGPIILSLN
jgi:hypothetical protein